MSGVSPEPPDAPAPPAARGRDGFLGSAALIAGLTMLSRLLGLARDVLCAAVFGAGMVWDAFSFGFRVPNLFRRLFGEGALSAAFIPIFAEHLELRPKEEASLLAGRVAVALGLVLLALLVAGECVLLGLWGWLDLGERWRLAVGLTALMLPYMLFVCMTALAGGVLHAMRQFAAPALAPVVLNVCWILTLAFVAPRVSDELAVQAAVLGGGILAGGVLQLLLQVVALRRLGFRWRLSLDVLQPQVRRVAAAMLPVALGLAALQINVLLDGVIAISLAAPAGRDSFSLLGIALPYPMEVGANSVLYYGNRLMQFPLGVFGIALATAAFPALSAHAARRDWEGFAAGVVRGLGAVLLIGLPAGVGLMVLRYPAIELLFERGAFTGAETRRTAAVVLAYSTAIWAYCALHLLTRAFYGLQQAATPARVAAGAVVLNLALNLTLVWPLGEAGLAAATALSATAQVAVLCWLLRRRVPLDLRPLRATAFKTGLATLCMAAACLGVVGWVPPGGPGTGMGLKLARAFVPMAAGGIAYVAVVALLRTEELGTLLRQVLRPHSGRGA